MTAFLGPLAEQLDLNEVDGRAQFRPAGEEGRRWLTERGVPAVLRPLLAAISGEGAGALPRDAVDDVHDRLAVAVASPVERANVLLSWLGRLTVPAEALWGEGVLVRQLLARLDRDDIAAAAIGTRTGDAAMGLVNLVMHHGDDGTLADAVSPTLRQLFPPGPTTGEP